MELATTDRRSQAPVRERRRAISHGKRIAFWLILVLLTLGAVELGMRTLYYVLRKSAYLLPVTEVHPRIRSRIPYDPALADAPVQMTTDRYVVKNGYYTYNPATKEITQAAVTSPVNSLGFRGSEPAPKGDHIRVWCLGGSSTFGYSVRRSYPEQLEEVLNQQDARDRYQVINGGIVFANAQHLYHMLLDQHLVSLVQPDVLVVSTLWNTTDQYENRFLTETIQTPWLRRLPETSITAFFIYKLMLLAKYREQSGPFQALSAYIDLICRWASAHRAYAIILAEPLRLSTAGIWTAAADHPINHAHGLAVLQRVVSRYGDRFQVVSVPLFERTEWSAEELKRYIITKGHLTEEGYGVVAQTVAPAIQRFYRHPEGRQ